MARIDADPNVAAVLAVSVAQQIIERLTRKGVLTTAEGTNIYVEALDSLSPELRAEARRILKTLMPDLGV